MQPAFFKALAGLRLHEAGIPSIRWAVIVASGAVLSILTSFDDRRLLLVGALSIVVASGVISRRLVTPRGYPLGVGAAVLALGLLSAACSAAPSWGVLGVAFTLLGGIVLFVLAADLDRGSAVDYPLLVGLAFILPVGLACLAMVVIVYSALLSGVPLAFPEPVANFANIRFFNQFQTWTLSFLAAAVALRSPLPRAREAFWKALVIAIAVFFCAMYWRTSGRGTGYATALATLAVAVFLGPEGKRHALRIAGFAAAGYGVYLVMFDAGSTANARMLSAAVSGRWYLWDTALHISAQNPWLGIGPLLFAATDNGVASHPHNAVVQWAVEWGLPAALLLTATVGWLLVMSLYRARKQLKQANDAPTPLIVAIVASLLAGAAHALVSGVIVMPLSQFMLILVAALGLAILGRSPTRRSTQANALQQAGLALPVLSIVAALAVLYVDLFTAYDYAQRVRRPHPDLDVYTRNALQPRYWADGTLAPWVTRKAPTLK